MIFLNASQTEFLLHSPESGMGFQFVEVALKVTANRGLLPGTFATTAADAARVGDGQSGREPLRAAQSHSGVHRFTIQAPAGTSLQRGIAQPAYGQSGGGVEVIFTAGSPDHTVTLPPDIIPP